MTSEGLSLEDRDSSGSCVYPFGDMPDEVEQATVSMKKLATELASNGFSSDESFYTLCESSLMKNTFWSHPGMRVVRPRTQSSVGNQDIVGSYLHADLLEFHPAQTPGQTLQSFADELFEATTARPPIIRILYHSDESQPIDFNSLRSFVPLVSSDDAGLSAAGREKKYVVLAVVRLNDSNNKHDYVRTYMNYGPEIIGEYEPPSFMAHRWSVRDAPAKYMLIYGLHEQRSNDPTDSARFPEVGTYPISQEDLSLYRIVDLDLKRAILALKASEAESTTTDTKLFGDSHQSNPEYKDPRIKLDGLYRPKRAWYVKENSPGYGSDRPFKE
ncbi:uncharacterized protein FSUBG_12342 [Fusarium subglutinans]|uniref:Uncharacterized protein n=1 Tax=Gibberella subglutinans TaxID=42677 RepID=A0A8H5L6T1_GIBSU|nr:uncharacterized protein FSUBG_12342 [Fusarium subglutinans]KAF5585753.1 hypothetical protein FSUBG_12342 [Fusarium subglutinans]